MLCISVSQNAPSVPVHANSSRYIRVFDSMNKALSPANGLHRHYYGDVFLLDCRIVVWIVVD
jgi:hypothetical protein